MEIAQLRGLRDELQDKLLDAESRAEAAEIEARELRDELTQADQRISKDEDFISKAKRKIIELQDEIDELHGALDQRDGTVSALQRKTVDDLSRTQSLESQLVKRDSALDIARTDLDKSTTQLSEADKAVERLQHQARDQSDQIVTLEEDLRETRNELRQTADLLQVTDRRAKVLETVDLTVSHARELLSRQEPARPGAPEIETTARKPEKDAGASERPFADLIEEVRVLIGANADASAASGAPGSSAADAGLRAEEGVQQDGESQVRTTPAPPLDLPADDLVFNADDDRWVTEVVQTADPE